MRVGWATPFNVRSAIGKFSLFVCEELRTRGHEIEIIRVESGPELEMDALNSDFSVTDAGACNVHHYDALVANFGNHAPYHAQVLRLLAQRAPLGIFHDIEMRHFEWGLQEWHRMSVPRLIGVEQEKAEEGHDDLVDPAARPLLASLAAMTCSAVIHGPHYRKTVAAYCPGPVEMIPFCFPDTGSRRTPPLPSQGRRVTIFGMINDHKQPRRVLRAIALLRSRVGAIELHLAGAFEDHYRDSLLEEADALRIQKPVFHGYVSDDQLQDILEDSHAICCLRYPVTEGSSASLVTALYRARPLVISDIASFSLVPDEVAYKVSYGDGPEDVAKALLDIFSRPDESERKAMQASKWASERFSAQSYVDNLEPLLLSLGRHETLTRLAHNLIPAVTTPEHDPMRRAVHALAKVLDWMDASQK